MNKSLTTTIIVIVAIVIGVGIYFWSIGGTPVGGSSLLSSNTNQLQNTVGSEELALLNQVTTIKINASFFTSELFLSLNDIVQPVPTVEMGRANPFAPVSGAPSPFGLSQGQSSTQTQSPSSVQRQSSISNF